MSKLEERESRRKESVVGQIAGVPASTEQTPDTAGRGRPKETRETKKRISLAVLPSLYDDIQKVAYVQRRSVSELLSSLMEQYREDHQEDLEEYDRLKSAK